MPPVTTPTGSCTPNRRCCATRSAPSVTAAPVSAAGTIVPPAGPSSSRAIGPAISDTKAIGPVTAVASAQSATPTPSSRKRERLDAAPQRPRGVVTELQRPSGAAQRQKQQREHRDFGGEQGCIFHLHAVEAAGQPGHRLLHFDQPRAGEDVRHDRGHHRAHADAHQHDAIGADAMLPGDQVDQASSRQIRPPAPPRPASRRPSGAR